jgi:hypothetical protein
MMVDCREEYFGIQTVDADMALSNRRMYFHILFVNLIHRLTDRRLFILTFLCFFLDSVFIS